MVQEIFAFIGILDGLIMGVILVLVLGVVLYGLYLALRLALAVNAVWGRVVVHPIRFEFADEFPQEFIQLFERPIEELAELGFEPVSYLSIYNIRGVRDWTILLQDQAATTFAHLSISGLPIRPYSISYHTFLEDDSLVLTINGVKHGIIGTIPNTILTDDYQVGIKEHWKVHQDTLNEIPQTKNILSLSWKASLDRMERHYQNYLDHLAETKQVGWDDEKNYYTLHLIAVVRLALKLMKGSRKEKTLHQRMFADAKQKGISPIKMPISFTVRNYLEFKNGVRRRASVRTKVSVLVVSLVLFALSFWLPLGPNLIGPLIGVIAFHELGHFMAMKLVGYKNISPFFLPFIGAAVAGEKSDANIKERMLVFFAGPLPGLTAGFLLLFAFTIWELPDSLWAWTVMLLAINYVNLLPLYPFDGGRILDELLFENRPYAGIAFKVLGVGGFLLAGIWLNDKVLLGAGLLLAVGIPLNFRISKIIKSLKIDLTELQNSDEEESITRIFLAIENAGFREEQPALVYQVVDKVLGHGTNSTGVVGVRIGFGLLYLISLGSGLLLVAWYLLINL